MQLKDLGTGVVEVIQGTMAGLIAVPLYQQVTQNYTSGPPFSEGKAQPK